MNPSKTWILVALALGLGAFIFWNDRQRDAAGTRDDPALKALPAFTQDTVASVEVHLRTNQIYRVDRTNNEWMLTLPIKYPANSARIEGLLPIFGRLNSKSHISAQELQAQKQPLSAFGLAPPAATLIVTQDTNRWELKIGGKGILEKQVYVQLVGSEGIYFTSADFLDRLPRTVDDWRDPFFLRTKGLAFNRIEVRTGTGSFELQKDTSTLLWKLSQPLEARANNAYIEDLLRALQNWRIARFEDGGQNPDLESCGLRPPESTLILGQGTNNSLVAYFGKSPTNDDSLVYALCQGQPSVVLVPVDCLEKLRVRAPYIQLRDQGLLPASLAGAKLIEVATQGNEKFSIEKSADGGWSISSPEKAAADPELMRNFLGDITTAGIIEFVKDVATDFDYTSAGLIPPKRSYVFRGFLTNTVEAVTNPPITSVEFGAEQNGRVLARVAYENSIYAVRAEVVKRLPSQAFQLWDRQLWRFATNEVKGIIVAVGGATNGIARDASQKWRFGETSKPLDPLTTGILDEFLFCLGNMRAESWVACGEDKVSAFGFHVRPCHLSIDVTRQGKSQTFELDLGNRTLAGNYYAATVWNGKKVIFELRSATYDYFVELAKAWAAAIGVTPGKP